MPTDIAKNTFYNTFTPFIDKNTKSAEKTMKGRYLKRHKEPPYRLSKEFYNYLSAGGMLAFPILALAVSKRNIFAAMKKTDKEYFKLINRNSKGFIHKIYQKTAEFKKTFLEYFWGAIKPLKIQREKIAFHLKKDTNESLIARFYRFTNNIFKNLKDYAAQRQYLEVTTAFKKLEESIEPVLKVFEDSAHSKVKVVFPKHLLKVPAETPQPVDMSKMLSGKLRSDEAKRIIKEIKRLLISDKGNFDDIVKKITFSCEDIFFKAESTLASLKKTVTQLGFNDEATDGLIKKAYQDLIRYRFAELVPSMKNATARELRMFHLNNINETLAALKNNIPRKQSISNHLETLRDLLTEKAAPESMGLLEELRDLLKCNDIAPKCLKDGVNSSLLKHYNPNNYLNLKKEIDDFARKLKFAQKTKKELLPNDMREIDRGGIFTKALAVGIPGTILGVKIYNSEPGENKAKSKRNFYSFLAGSLVIGLSNYCTMNSHKKSIIYGIIAAFLTSRLAERYIKK